MATQPPLPPSTGQAAQTKAAGSAPQGWPAMWLHRNLRSWALWPVSQLYRALIALRAALYKMGALRSQHPGKPVIVVGNVVAGGSGKTPVVMALVRYLQSQGLRPGVISRGYGRTTTDCRAVLPHAVASEVGDEPLLIATQCQVPVYVARQRIQAARALLAQHPDTDVLVCDDGLQHLALARDIDICIFNAQGTGNGFLLPAGPLREPWPRPVDWVLYAGETPSSACRHWWQQGRLKGSSLSRPPPPGRPCRGGRRHSRCAEHPARPPPACCGSDWPTGSLFCDAGGSRPDPGAGRSPARSL